MKYLFTMLAFLLVLACSVNTKVQINDVSHEAYRPPNCIQIAENLFADETEVANIDYKEYLYWNMLKYGKESKNYLELLPDTTVWTTISYGMPFKTRYFRHPYYDNHPVVGLTLEQAKKYTEWRTERVAEMYLMHKGFIKEIRSHDTLKTFTVERYKKGGYDWIIKKEPFLLAKFKIPTIEEWEQMAAVGSKFKYGVDSLSQHNKKFLKKCNTLFNTKNNEKLVVGKKCYLLLESDLPNGVREFSKNINNIYNTIGNVAEMVDVSNTSKGGSWYHSISDIEITKNDTFTSPNSWTGFRNVCTFELVEVSQN